MCPVPLIVLKVNITHHKAWFWSCQRLSSQQPGEIKHHLSLGVIVKINLISTQVNREIRVLILAKMHIVIVMVCHSSSSISRSTWVRKVRNNKTKMLRQVFMSPGRIQPCFRFMVLWELPLHTFCFLLHRVVSGHWLKLHAHQGKWCKCFGQSMPHPEVEVCWDTKKKVAGYFYHAKSKYCL